MSNVLKFNYFFCKFRWFVILWTQISFFGTVHYYNTINNILIAFQRRRWIQSFAVRVTLWPNKFTFVTQVSIFRPKFRSFYRRHILPVRKLALFNCRHISLLLRLRFCLLWLNSVPPAPVSIGVLSLVCIVQTSIFLRRTVSRIEGNTVPPPVFSILNCGLHVYLSCRTDTDDQVKDNTTPFFHWVAHYCNNTVWPLHHSKLCEVVLHP
jgi:hypothetical protein